MAAIQPSGTSFADAVHRGEEYMEAGDLSHFKRQHCSVCSCEEKFNFHVPDDLWEKVVPEAYRQKVVCLSCFDSFARDRDVNYANAIGDLYFAGDKASLKFEPESARDV
jgi:hypothetical protein